jgi:hypothetical protein
MLRAISLPRLLNPVLTEHIMDSASRAWRRSQARNRGGDRATTAYSYKPEKNWKLLYTRDAKLARARQLLHLSGPQRPPTAGTGMINLLFVQPQPAAQPDRRSHVATATRLRCAVGRHQPACTTPARRNPLGRCHRDGGQAPASPAGRVARLLESSACIADIPTTIAMDPR